MREGASSPARASAGGLKGSKKQNKPDGFLLLLSLEIGVSGTDASDQRTGSREQSALLLLE
jgi:hypothetical protein